MKHWVDLHKWRERQAARGNSGDNTIEIARAIHMFHLKRSNESGQKLGSTGGPKLYVLCREIHPLPLAIFNIPPTEV